MKKILLILLISSCSPRLPIFQSQGQVIMVKGDSAAISFNQYRGTGKAYEWFKIDSVQVGDIIELLKTK